MQFDIVGNPNIGDAILAPKSKITKSKITVDISIDRM